MLPAARAPWASGRRGGVRRRPHDLVGPKTLGTRRWHMPPLGKLGAEPAPWDTAARRASARHLGRHCERLRTGGQELGARAAVLDWEPRHPPHEGQRR